MKTKIKEYKYFIGTSPITSPVIFMQKENRKRIKTSWLSLIIIILCGILGYLEIYKASMIEYPNLIQTRKIEGFLGEISAYNVGIPEQNYGNPCISAHNVNVCQLVEQGVKIVANNCLPKGTEIEIDGVGRFVVLDKMNSRYGCDNFDIAMGEDEIIEAIQFGRQERRIKIYE